MKKILVIGILVILLLVYLPNYSAINVKENEESIILNYEFNKPKIEKIMIDGNNYDNILLDDLSYISDPGKPCVPVKTVKILLPINAQVKNLIVTGNIEKIDGNYNVIPCGESIPYSYKGKIPAPTIDQKIYSSLELFPGKLYKNIGVQSFRGYDILLVDLFPVQYIPQSKELYYHNNINIEVKTEYKEKNDLLFRNVKKDVDALNCIVDNPSLTENYQFKDSLGESYDMLIITPDKFKSGFQSLADEHTYSKDDPIVTKIKTLEEIESQYSGAFLKEKIKDCIYQEFQNNGIEYVLLGGDESEIPVHKKVISVYNEILSVATDEWYSNLDNDLIPEVYIGRACVENNNELSNFLDKTINYLQSNQEDYYKVLLVGEDLEFSGDSRWGSNFMDELIDECSNHYYTKGIPTNKYSLSTLYERDWPGKWYVNDLKNEINNGVFIINHLGHSNHREVMRLEQSEIRNLANEKNCFIYSQGCFAGAFDPEIMHKFGEEGCCAESFTVETNTGAFAVIMNTRYGVGSWGTTDAPSQSFNRQFWDAVFSESSNDPNMIRLGVANHDSKVDCINKVESDYTNGHKLCYWQLTLFGDPTLKIRTPNVNLPTKPQMTGPKKWIKDVEGIYTGISDDSISLSYKFNWGDKSETGWITPDNNGKAYGSHTWNEDKKYFLRVKTKNNIGFESAWSDGFKIDVKNINTNPPDRPILESDQTSGYIHHSYEFETISSDPDNDQIKYGFDFNGDDIIDEWSEYMNSNIKYTFLYIFRETGNHNVKVKACDINGIESCLFSEEISINIISDPDNSHPPQNPTILGETKAKPGKKSSDYVAQLDYEVDRDQVYCYWDFGDGTTSADFEYEDGGISTNGWLGPYDTPNYNAAIVNHTWQKKGTYTLTLRCKDEHDAEAKEDTMEIKVEKEKTKNKLESHLFEKIFSFRILQNYPRLIRIINKISNIL